MQHELPIRNARLSACSEGWHQMTPTERGRHCRSCQREVIDFTRGSTADLARASAAAPDGRVCGRFSAGQVDRATRRSQLRPRLRLFLAAVVLVLLQGFSARQAWAQLQPTTPHVCPPLRPGQVGMVESMEVTGSMSYKAGSLEDFERLVSSRLQWPRNAKGRPVKAWRRRLRVVCSVDTTGQVYASLLLGFHSYPAQEPFLTELNRVLAPLPQPFVPATHYGRLITATAVLRFTFPHPRT